MFGVLLFLAGAVQAGIISGGTSGGGSSSATNLTGPVTSVGAATTIVGPVPATAVDLSTVTTALATKQATGNYITGLTGGVTASGPGSVGATVVTNANLTGPVTSVGNATTIVGPVPTAAVDLSTVTTALATKQATGNYITALTGGVTASGPGSVGATVVTNANLTGNVTSVGNATTLASIPAISGANLTSITAANISAGSLGASVIASSVAAGAISMAAQINNLTITLAKLAASGCITNQIPKFDGTNWVCGADATGVTGAATLIDTQTFSGAQTVASSFTVTGNTSIGATPRSFITVNKIDGLMIDLSGVSVYAKSIDGATQSSGCVVMVGMSGNTPTSFLNFTSTVTASLSQSTGNNTVGVLLESCVPGTFCRVGVKGVYRVQSTNISHAGCSTCFQVFSTTRCNLLADGTASVHIAAGRSMSETDASGFFYLGVGGL